MTPEKHIEALGRLDQYGLPDAFSSQELERMYSDLRRTISIGINRTTEPTTTDGGLLAYPTSITPITHHDTNLIPPGTQAITCACGGTNWLFSVATKQEDGSVTLSEPFIKPIPEKERQHTYASLIDLIATEIMNVVHEYNLDTNEAIPIAVSFGFPQTTIRLPNGDMDARITQKALPKFWRVEDCDESIPAEQQPSLAGLLRETLTTKGMQQVGPIVFINDTVAVALDVEDNGRDSITLPAGFVFGTGVNAAMASGNAKGIVNLEAGHATIIPKNELLAEMEKRKLAPHQSGYAQEMELVMGGAYLPGRVAAAVALIGDILTDPEQLIRTVTTSSNQGIVSDIARGIPSGEMKMHVGPSESEILQEIAQRVLTHTAQLIGVMLAAVSAETGYSKGTAFVPYEGALLHKGFGVQEKTNETLRLLLPHSDMQPYKANGIAGVAKLAMCKAVVRGFI